MRFMFIYPNNTGNPKVPLGCMYLITILKNLGHEVAFFDMTFYGIDIEKHDINIRGRLLNFRPIDLEPWGVTYTKATKQEVFSELQDRVRAFAPDIIGVTLTEDTSLFGLEAMQAAKCAAPDAVMMAGGVFCMTEPLMVLSHPVIDMVSIGEGEVCMPEMFDRLEKGLPTHDVKGFWVKDADGTIHRNEVAAPIDLNDLPIPDLDLIDERHFYSPMAGNVYKMTFVEGQRGCPRRCTYCCNQLFLDAYRGHIKHYLRKKTIPRLVEELEQLKNNYGFDFFQFTDDDFTLRSEEELREFKRLYLAKVNVPFWCQAEANNISDEKIRLMREAGCIAISMGIETGSHKILTEVYKRKTSQAATIKAFRIMHKYGIRTSGNIIVGVPQETRDDIFSTIELARKCRPKSLNVNIFAPYRGTELRRVCIEKGYLDDSFVRDGRRSWEPVLDLPQISKEEIVGLVRTFALYCTLPRDTFPLIERCETVTPESSIIFDNLEMLFWEITEQIGIDFYVPGVDYSAKAEERRQQLLHGGCGCNR